jgi:hypothetical protein
MDEVSVDEYQVMLAGGQMRALSLDQLDALYQAGAIDEASFVLPPGTTEWTRLGILIGVEDDAAAAPPTQASPMQAAPVYTPAPAASLPAPSPIAQSSVIPSTRPVAFDLDDMPETALRPKRRAPVFVALGLAAVGAAGFFAWKTGKLGPIDDAASTAAAAAAAVPATPPPAPEPAAATPIAQSAAVAPPILDTRPKLTDEQRKALAKADEQHAAKAAAAHAARTKHAASSHHGKRAKEKVFSNGGDEHDPLNAKL